MDHDFGLLFKPKLIVIYQKYLHVELFITISLVFIESQFTIYNQVVTYVFFLSCLPRIDIYVIDGFQRVSL